MNVTTEQIETNLLDFFNPFVYIAVTAKKTKGGFDIRNINGTHLRFIIFDKEWRDDDKVKIWEETYEVKYLNSLDAIKTTLAPQIEKSIRIFCNI